PIDKVCIAVTLMKVRFGSGLEGAPRSLLRFIAQTRFRHAVRSITHLIDGIAFKALKDRALRVGESDLPIGDLKFHLFDSVEKAAEQWADLANDSHIVNLRRPVSLYAKWRSVGQTSGG